MEEKDLFLFDTDGLSCSQA